MPRAKNPAERSSSWIHVRIPGWESKHRVSGVERDPGLTTASVTLSGRQPGSEGRDGAVSYTGSITRLNARR